MAAQAVGKKQISAATEETVAAEVELLAQRLVRQATSIYRTAHSEQDGKDQEIILDLEVEGVRCLLVRFQPQPNHAAAALSPREQEIARMVAKGYPNKTIASALKISSWTVCTHLRRIFAKLGVGSRAAMVARLLEESSTMSRTKPHNPRRAAQDESQG